MSDLLVTTHTPALRSGQAVRTYGVARALAARGPLDLLYVRFGAERPDAAFSSIDGVRLHELVPSRGAGRAMAYARARLTGVPAGFARGISPELLASASALAEQPGRARVVADGPIAAAALAPLAQRRAVVYNAHNLESGFRHQLQGGERERRSLRAFERRLLERASEAWLVSEADIAAARELAPAAHLRYVPNVVDVAAIAPVQPERSQQRLLFVASFTYEPNRNGLRFLIEQVLPRVWERLPQARLMLVGSGLEQPPSADPRVETVGFVEDLREAYARCSCAVVPLLQGGGTPLKFIEALAYGLPVVATPRAAAGLAVQDGVDCLLADGADAFAAAVSGVLRDGGRELARHGRALAAERYSVEALTDLLASD